MTQIEEQKSAQRLFVRAAATNDQQAEACLAGSTVSTNLEDNLPSYTLPSTSGGCPVVGGQGGQQSTPGGCPVVTSDFNPSNLMPQSSNQPTPGQSQPLGRQRIPSTIPVADDGRPAHQEADSPVWMYPSEQMFYNAMKRKGWSPSEHDMQSVVAIHNGVNERAWSEVLQWEKMHVTRCGGPRLKKFAGRPQDYSPKARLLNFLGYKLPFDRHDWVVDRCGKEVRYVVDFYNAAPLPGMPIAMHLDVRPALDSPSALLDRLRMQYRWMNSGRWKGQRTPPQPQPQHQPQPSS
ncbi:hypothetical protein WJX82_005812 [Trebouxia sp. C0006]